MLRSFLTPFLFTALTTICAAGELHTLTLDSGSPGPVVVIVAPECAAGSCGLDAVRQLQYRRPTSGTLVLAEAVADFSTRALPAGWARVSEPAELDRQYPGHYTLVFREDVDAWSYTPAAEGDVVHGEGADADAVMAELKSLPPLEGREWKLLPSDGDVRKISVITNAREYPEKGFRPAERQRELRHAAYGLLRHLGMIAGWSETDALFPEKQAGVVRVALFDDGGALNDTGRRPAWIRYMLSLHPDFRVELVGASEIRGGALDRADVLLMGGGKAGVQKKTLGEDGCEAIRRYVRDGGGYLGICAGAYLGASDYINPDPAKSHPHLGLLPVDTKDTDGNSDTPLEWYDNPTGPAKNEKANLHGGPRFLIHDDATNIRVWARFIQDEPYEGGNNVLTGLPAIVSGNFGAGKVLLFSTHCERRPTSASFLPDALRWCASSERRADPPLVD